MKKKYNYQVDICTMTQLSCGYKPFSMTQSKPITLRGVNTRVFYLWWIQECSIYGEYKSVLSMVNTRVFYLWWIQECSIYLFSSLKFHILTMTKVKLLLHTILIIPHTTSINSFVHKNLTNNLTILWCRKK